MLRIKRALLMALSGFASFSLVAGARAALDTDALEGWSSGGLDWLLLDAWQQEWCWQWGLVGAGLGLLVGWAYGAEMGEAQSLTLLQRITRLLACVPVALGLLFLSRYGPGIVAQHWRPRPATNAPNVLLVLLDTWRADHTSFLGYGRETMPLLDRLVESGAVFEEAKAQSGWTKPSVASILTGLMPSKHQAVSQPGRDGPRHGVNLKASVQTVAELLRAEGWDTGMWSNNPNIIPERGFAQGAGYFRAYRKHSWMANTVDPGRSESMLPDVEQWIERRRNPERPFFAYVHIMDPHLPYEAPAPFGGMFDTSGLDFQIGPKELQAYQRGDLLATDVSPAMLQRIIDAYDEELAYVDHHVGAFLTRIQAQYPETLVLLMGDHGEEFLDHGQFGHAHSLYEELVHVPLVVWGPGVRAGRIKYQVRLLDVMPTILGSALPLMQRVLGLQGEDLAPLWHGRQQHDRGAPMETGGEGNPNFHWRGYSDGRYKVLRREKDPHPPGARARILPWESKQPRPFMRIYDLMLDPGELHPLGESDFAGDDGIDKGEGLWKQFVREGWYTAPEDLFADGAARHSAASAELDRLQELGYGGADEEQDQE